LPQQQQQPPASNQQQSGNNALSSANASGNQSNFFTSYPPYRYSSTQSGPSQFVLQRAPSVSTPMASQGLLVPSLQPGRSGLSNGTISGIQLGGGPLLVRIPYIFFINPLSVKIEYTRAALSNPFATRHMWRMALFPNTSKEGYFG